MSWQCRKSEEIQIFRVDMLIVLYNTSDYFVYRKGFLLFSLLTCQGVGCVQWRSSASQTCRSTPSPTLRPSPTSAPTAPSRLPTPATCPSTSASTPGPSPTPAPTARKHSGSSVTYSSTHGTGLSGLFGPVSVCACLFMWFLLLNHMCGPVCGDWWRGGRGGQFRICHSVDSV